MLAWKGATSGLGQLMPCVILAEAGSQAGTQARPETCTRQV